MFWVIFLWWGYLSMVLLTGQVLLAWAWRTHWALLLPAVGLIVLLLLVPCQLRQRD